MVLKLYGYPMSTWTRFVAMVCKEKEIPYEFIHVDLKKGEHKTPEYIKNQPFAQVPYIDDDGFILYESRAIARYLLKKYPNQGNTELIPTDLQEEALFEQAVYVEVFHWHTTLNPFLFETVFKPSVGGTTDTAKAEEALAKAKTRLDVYDRLLGERRYVAGNKFTLADLQHFAYASTLYDRAGRGDIIDERPNIARWWKEVSQRPSWQAVKNGP